MKTFLVRLFTLPWRMLGWLRATLANVLMLLLVVAVLLAVSDQEEGTSLPDTGVLHVVLGETLVEQRNPSDPMMNMLAGDHSADTETVLQDITQAIRWAATDDRIRAMAINTDNLQGSDLAKLDSLAQAIADFRATHKPVIATADNLSQAQYFIASCADTIYLNPMGSVQLQGFAAHQSYMKDLLDRLAVNVHVFRAGEFKSFIEPFVRNDMSPEARANLQQWLDEQWRFYTQTVEQRRKLTGSIDQFIASQDTLLADNGNNPAKLAVAYGLVDHLAARNAADNAIDNLIPAAERIDANTYYRHERRRQEASNLLARHSRIAIIHASGPIVDGEQNGNTAAAETLIEQIRDARKDDAVVAIVLRIDSPGGSAFAAELIREELAATQADGKPVVASMSGVAASGGYWIAASADEIWASPATITGSIGVFGLFPTLEDSLSNLGIHSDGYSTTPLADAMQVDRPLNPMAGRVLQQGVDFTYREFLRLVAEGRDSKPSVIDGIAQGRVWTGAHAQGINLVDHLGTLDQAISAAARLAKVERFSPKVIAPAMSPFESLMNTLSGTDSQLARWLTQHGMGHLATVPALLLQTSGQSQPLFNDPHHIYASCQTCAYQVR